MNRAARRLVRSDVYLRVEDEQDPDLAGTAGARAQLL